MKCNVKRLENTLSKEVSHMIGHYLFGNYHERACIYSGRYADVYDGVHVSLGRRAAIKALDLGRARNAEERRRLDERFYHEACMLEAAKHPTVVELYDYGEQGSLRYIAMEYAALGSLSGWYPFGQRVPDALILSYTRQIGRALQRLHDLGLIHRDIKPDNIFLNAKRQIMLGDFGLVVEERLRRHYRLYGGTRFYMPPEQEQGYPEFASDQYALATMVFEWLTGHAPFEGMPEEVSWMRRHYDAPSPRLFVPGIPVALERTLLRALHRSPLHRYEHVIDFVEALEDAMQPVTTKHAASARQSIVTRPAAGVLTSQQRRARRLQHLALRRRPAAPASEPLTVARGASPHEIDSQEWQWEENAWSIEVGEHEIEAVQFSVEPEWR